MRALMLGLSICLAACTTPPRSPDEITSRNAIMSDDGDMLGEAINSKTQLKDGRTRYSTQLRYKLKIGETGTGQILNDTSQIVSTDGKVEEIRNTHSVDRVTATIEAKISGNLATIVRTAVGNTQSKRVDLPMDIRFDNGTGLLKAWPPELPIEATYSALDIYAPAIEVRTLREIDFKPKKKNRHIVEQRYRHGTLLSRAELNIDQDRTLISTERPTFGTTITEISRAAPSSGNQTNGAADFLDKVLVKSPVRINRSARQGRIRYTFNFTTDKRITVPDTGEQRSQIKDDKLIVNVCRSCGTGLATDTEFLEDATQPAFWLQSDAPELANIGARAKARDQTETEIMQALTRRAFRHLREINFTGHVSALETYNRRTGDCTESAVLLAALGRAAGIPTKVASGIVYSRERYHGTSNVFMPHAWTLAYVDGEWRSFDAALEEFDTTHIAFNISDGDPIAIAAGHQLASLVSWANIEEVRKRPKARN